MGLAKGWDRDSADLFIHDTGARISKSTYRGKMAWWFFPVSFDVPAVEHAPTDEGREEAFATAEREIPKTRSKPRAAPKKKPVVAEDEDKGRGPDADASAEEGESDDADKNEGEE